VSWQKYISGINFFNESATNYLFANLALKEHARVENICVREITFNGIIKEPVNDILRDAAAAFGARMWCTNRDLSKDQDEWRRLDAAYIADHGFFTVYFQVSNNNLNLGFSSTDLERIAAVEKALANRFYPEMSEGRVYTFSSEPGNDLISVGVAAVPLERGNYDENVLRSYDHIVNDLKSVGPSGRLSIIDGPPGTGKTFMVRALLHDVPKGMFVMLPADMVPSLLGPQMVTKLVRRKERDSSSGPLILLIEDADMVLTKRMGDNISAISSLLNVSSGIMGSLLDLRVIATTNAKEVEFDKAILRAGRLSAKVNVGKLDPERASTVVDRLLDGKVAAGGKYFDKPVTLAETYEYARSLGWIPEVAKTAGECSDTTHLGNFFDEEDIIGF
jgi:hypothetical protein